MSAVWIGFVGVIVGGLITTAWSWLTVVRQELGDAMVAARLVDEDLATAAQALRMSGGDARLQVDGHIWAQNRGALARVLGRQQWEEVSAAYRQGHQSSVGSLGDCVSTARTALAELVAGKRYVVPQRWRNMFHRRGSGRGGD
jgi:hypothetical protein